MATKNYRRNTDRRWFRSDPLPKLVAVLIVTSFVVFYRGVPDSFDLPKAVLALTFGSISVLTFVATRRAFLPRDLFVGVVTASTVAVVVSALRNPHTQLAWVGQEARFTGALLWLIAIAVGLIIYLSSDVRWGRVILQALFISGFPFALYGILQVLGWDPFEWNVVSFSASTVFSTAGNPNYASIFAAVFVVAAAAKLLTSTSIIVRLASGLLLTANWAICAFANSVQGLLAVALFGSLLLLISVIRPSRRGSASVQVVSVTITVVSAIGLLGSLSEGRIWILSAILFVLSMTASNLRGLQGFHGYKAYLFLAAVVILTVVSSLGRLSRFLESNLGERAAFYRAGFGMFSENPLLGHGFERYGRLFPRFRPEWHAVELENSLTGSAHSIWLGLAVSGGLLLLIPLLVLAGLGIRGALVSLRNQTREGEDWNVEEILSSLLVFMMVFLWFVSVEQVTVILLGVVVFSAQATRTTLSKRVSSNWNIARSAMSVLISSIVIVFGVLSVRWFTGNKALSTAYQEIFERQDLASGLEDFETSIRLGPMSDQARLRRLAIVSQLGSAYNSVIISDALVVADSYEYLGPIGISAAQNLLQAGAFEEAEFVTRKTLENNPNAPGVLAQGSAILEQLGD